MKTVNVQLSEDDLRGLIDTADSQIADLRLKIKALTAKRDAWASALKEPLEDGSNESGQAVLLEDDVNSLTGRLRRGFAATKVLIILQQGPKQMNEIAMALPSSVSTVWRILTKYKEDGKVEQTEDGRWQLKT